ncbi:MAG: hypothetical protein WCJ07_01770, partial [Verrucomicrobiota bacterium]
ELRREILCAAQNRNGRIVRLRAFEKMELSSSDLAGAFEEIRSQSERGFLSFGEALAKEQVRTTL